jgi:hypothetical protein
VGASGVQLVELKVVSAAERHQRLVGFVADRPAVRQVVQDELDGRPAPGADAEHQSGVDHCDIRYANAIAEHAGLDHRDDEPGATSWSRRR